MDSSEVFKPYSSKWKFDEETENCIYGYEPGEHVNRRLSREEVEYLDFLKNTRFDMNDMGVNLSTSRNTPRPLKVSELDDLYHKALENYPSKSMKPVNWLYRDKPGDFFTKAMAEGGMMTCYPKDQSGDPRSPINGKLDGLFFAINTEKNGDLPAVSFFGDTRIRVPAPFFFSPQSRHSCYREGSRAVKLYFADFYCMRGSSHWVTVVVTYDGSFADRFCEHKLFQLDLSNNDLLMVHKNGAVTMRDSELSIEVFYTTDVDLFYWTDCGGAVIEPVQPAGKGSSTIGGLSKNSDCPICWIPPPFYDY